MKKVLDLRAVVVRQGMLIVVALALVFGLKPVYPSEPVAPPRAEGTIAATATRPAPDLSALPDLSIPDLAAIPTMSVGLNDAQTQTGDLPIFVTTPLQRYGFGTLMCAAYSPDGRYVATCGGIGAVLWDATTGAVIRTFSGHTNRVRSVAFSPDGTKILTGSTDFTARLWDAATGAVIRTFSGHISEVNSVAFSPDGTKVLTGSHDFTAKLWDAATGAMTCTFSGHTNSVRSVAFSPDGTKVLTGSNDGTAKLWNPVTGAVIRTFSGHTSVLESVVFSPDGTKVLTGSRDYTAKLWAEATGTEIRTFSGHTSYILSVAFSPDGTKILTGSWDSTAKLWDAATGAVIRTFSGHTSHVYSVAFSPDGTKVLAGGEPFIGTGGGGNTARLWDAATGAEIRTFSGHIFSVNSVAFSPDGTKVLTGGGPFIGTGGGGNTDNTARLWDAATGAEIRTFSGHTDYVSSVAFSPDGTKVLTGSYDNTAKLWDAATGAEIRTFSGHSSWVLSVAFSPDGTKVLTGSGDRTVSQDSTAKLWDAATGAEIRTFSGHTFLVTSVAFSPDGTKVLTGSGDHTAKLWDAATGAEIRTFSGHTSWLLSVAFSPDGTKVLTGSWDSTAKLWDAATGAEINTFSGHSDLVSSVAFSPDGTKILTGSSDGTARTWELYPARAVIVAGGGDFVNNGIAQQTNDLVAYAYKVLKSRGYESANIKYLTAFGPADPTSPTLPFRDADGDGLNDVDGWATLETLRDAITGSFAARSGRLFVLFVDHGNRTEGFTAFRVNERQALLTTTLDTWLDDLQTSHPVDVALVVDCCYSGQFVADCRETSASLPAGRKRLVLASTSANAEAVFLPPPDMTSFIYQFLGSAYMGNSMGEAWRAGRRFFEEFPVAGQTPQIDDGTTGTGKADKEFFGATWAYGVHSTNDVNRFFPAFESWTTDTVVTPGSSVTLWTRLLPGQNPLEVVAVVRPPAPTVISGDPVSNLPHVSLHQNAGDPRLWEVTTSSVFASLGAYVVSFTARFEYERLSNPVFARITVSEGVDPDATPIRAILALGEGGSPSLDSAFEGLGAYAYGVYLARFQDNGGVHHPEWIEYLTPYPDSQRDGVPTTAGIIAAINNLPGDIGRLYVHLIGNSDAAGTIRFSSGEALTASALDAALDALQMRQTCAVVLAVDCPHSGSFLPVCCATGGQQRVVMAGSRASDTAFFLSWPVLSSFSQKYLASAYQGNHLKDGYSSARNFFAWFLLDLIQPQMDDNGDGVSNKYDGQLARSLYLGRRYAFAGDKASGLPFVLDVTTTQTAWPNEPVSFTARLVEGIEPTRVFAQLVPPGIDHSSGPISSIQEVAFTRDGPTSWTWTAAFAAPTSAGLYALVVYAAYPDGADERLSEPGYSALDVRINAGPPDAYEVDDTSATLNYFATNAPGQVHNFHKPNDADWAFFHANGGKIFTITVRDQATRCDAAIHFFKDGLSTGPKVIDNEPAGGAGGSNEMYSWLCPTTGTYYVRIVSADPAVCGNGTTYTLRILGNWGANCGLATIATNCSRSTGGTFDAEPMGVYTQPRLTVPPHAFGAEETKMLVMSPVDVGTNPLNPATRAWMQHPDQHTSNCTIVLFQNYPPVTAFQQPVALTFQMINDGPLYDGWYGAVRVDDLDADDVMANAKVYRWTTGSEWVVFDPSPTIVGQTVTTLISDLGTGYFAVSAQDPPLGSPPPLPPPPPVLNGEPPFTAGTTNEVTWGAVSGVTDYYAECDDDAGFGSPNQNSGWIAGTQWTATGLSDGVIYSYRVKCRNASMVESGWSDVVNSRQDASAPQTAVGALPAFETTVTFNVPWSGSDAGSGLASVRLFYRWGGSGPFTQYGGSFTASPISFNSGTTGGDGDYYFSTIGADNVGNVETAPAQPDAQTTVLTVPPPWPVLAAEPMYTAGTTNTVSWSAVAGAAAYYCEYDDASNFSSPQNSGWTTATLWTATGLTDGATYHYRAKSRNAALLESAWSNVVASRQDASPPSAPAPPADAGAFTSATSVRFDWTAASDGGSGVASYDLQVGTMSGGSDVLNANIGDMLTQTIGGANGQTLYARVRARDAVGNIGAWSANSDGITVDTVAPRLDSVTVRDSLTLEVTFNEPVVNADKAANYTCTGGLSVVSVTPLSATQYRLSTTDQSPGAPYSLTVGSGVKDHAGNGLDPAYGSRGFVGGGKTAVLRWELYR